MKKREASITTRLKLWWQSVAVESCPIEVKHTRGKKTFTMSELKEHQIDWLNAATTEMGCWWKIPDTGFGSSPFDVLFYKNSNAYVIIAFPVWVVAIHIHDIMLLDLKSLDEDTALQISQYSIQTANI